MSFAVERERTNERYMRPATCSFLSFVPPLWGLHMYLVIYMNERTNERASNNLVVVFFIFISWQCSAAVCCLGALLLVYICAHCNCFGKWRRFYGKRCDEQQPKQSTKMRPNETMLVLVLVFRTRNTTVNVNANQNWARRGWRRGEKNVWTLCDSMHDHYTTNGTWRKSILKEEEGE